jgi:protein O-mannosyl-transferase
MPIPDKKITVILLLLTVATLLAFWQVNYSDFIPQYDDGDYVTQNPHIQHGISIEGFRWALTATHAANWHPLTWMSHMLDIQLYGLSPQGHHLTNLLFHIANTLLLFLIFHRMTKALWQSAFVAALFALHPLHVESVAWVAERKDVLSTFFWMLTMGAYLYYVERPGLLRHFAVLIFFALGLMAKPMLVTLPFVLLLLDYWPLKRFKQRAVSQAIAGPTGEMHVDQREENAERQTGLKYQWSLIRSLLMEKIPLFVLAVLSCIVTYIVQQKAGAVAAIAVFPLNVRISNAFASYIFYIDKMIWPADLAVLYPYPRSWLIWLVVGAALPIMASTVIVILKARRFPYLVLGWLWYVGTLVPVIGLVQVGLQTRADRYTYIPLIGLFIIVAWGGPELIKEWRYRKEALVASSALLLLSLSAVTWDQVGHWKNNISLFNHTLRVTDKNSIMHNNRGNAYLELGSYAQAIEDYDKALEIDPKYAEAYNNRGTAYGILGYHTRAIEDFDKAIEINPQKYINAYYNRGVALGGLGRYEEGYSDLKTAARLGSEDAKKFLESHGVSWQ